ncbi:uncharacterized protein LOC129231239 isoform X2 [Uloborus diversus]|uniref:uncharacterized protein LOC129231239 isoform X2 n=1 Tax=Uloborus diversus TaxID=327109 RepID=UPI002409D60C|nr:uncharacterized protein LOC129231239 isoform X2 [Uloborus diversus]
MRREPLRLEAESGKSCHPSCCLPVRFTCSVFAVRPPTRHVSHCLLPSLSCGAAPLLHLGADDSTLWTIPPSRSTSTHRMVLLDVTAESRPFFVPTLATLVPPYHPLQFHQAMTSKEAECPPIQMEPVDLSVNKKTSSPSVSPRLSSLSFPSPASSPPSSSCIDLRLHSTRPSGPGDDTSSSADEHSPLSLDRIPRTSSSAYLSLQRIKQASLVCWELWTLPRLRSFKKG